MNGERNAICLGFWGNNLALCLSLEDSCKDLRGDVLTQNSNARQKSNARSENICQHPGNVILSTWSFSGFPTLLPPKRLGHIATFRYTQNIYIISLWPHIIVILDRKLYYQDQSSKQQKQHKESKHVMWAINVASTLCGGLLCRGEENVKERNVSYKK